MMSRRRWGAALASAGLSALVLSIFQASAAPPDLADKLEARSTAAALDCDPARCAPASCDPRDCDPGSCLPAACDVETQVLACELALDLTAADCEPSECALVCAAAADENAGTSAERGTPAR